MTDILNKATVLILNRNWQAINIRTPQEAFCMMATNVEYPDAKDIVGIATEPGVNHASRTEDAIYVDVREWTAKMESEAKSLQEKLGILTRPKRIHGHAKEYPDVPVEGVKMKKPRNKPCPCGSGKKYKHCCLNKQR